MRKGTNPEKFKNERNEQKFHRIIVPVYIPNVEEAFYRESLNVFESSLRSLISSVDTDLTAITVINNNSHVSVGILIDKYKKYIDKLVIYKENKGKIYAVLSETKSSFEPFVTIADADVLYFSGWETEVFKIFKSFPKAGIVSPLPTPNNAFQFNCSLIFGEYWKGNLKYGKLVKDEDIDLYTKGINFDHIVRRDNKKFSWKEKQYYLKDKCNAVVGAGHFIATYKSFLFKESQGFPEYKFRNGDEALFLDNIADKKGYYRLSTPKTWVYHMGNQMDEVGQNIKIEDSKKIKFKDTQGISVTPEYFLIPYIFKKGFCKILRKLKSF